MCFYTDGLVGGLALSKVSLSGRQKKFSSSVYIPLEGGNASAHLTRLPPAKIHIDGRERGTSLFSWLLCVCVCVKVDLDLIKGDLQSKNNQGAGYQSNLFCFFVSFKRDSSKKSEARCILRDSPCESLYSAWYLSLEEAIGCVREQGLPI